MLRHLILKCAYLLFFPEQRSSKPSWADSNTLWTRCTSSVTSWFLPRPSVFSTCSTRWFSDLSTHSSTLCIFWTMERFLKAGTMRITSWTGLSRRRPLWRVYSALFWPFWARHFCFFSIGYVCWYFLKCFSRNLH